MKLKLLLIGLSLFGALGFFFLSDQEPAVAQMQCTYKSTEVQVQKDINSPWTNHIDVGCNQGFRIGAFRNGTGQLASDSDTVLRVTGPGMDQYEKNGTFVFVKNNGTYTLNVGTVGQTGNTCGGTATVTVNCNNNKPDTNACQYGSTQARVQTDIKHDWKPSIDIKCGQKFNVGSFHNGIDRFAEDTTIRVQGPQGLNHTFGNATRLRALYPGTYKVLVTTNGKTGGACEEQATVNVSCPSDWWRD
jgi:hypothetical protein